MNGYKSRSWNSVSDLSETAFKVGAKPSFLNIASTRLTIATASSLVPCSSADAEKVNSSSATAAIAAKGRTIEALPWKDERGQ